MIVKVAAVQPESIWGNGEWQNAIKAVQYLEKAAATGAQLVCFPEGYPGPAHGPLDSREHLPAHPIEMIARKAKELGVYVAASNVEENPVMPGTYYLSQKLISPQGQVIADHRRVQPDEPDLNEYLFNGKRDFIPGDSLTVADTTLGRVGLLICSELFVPELARIEMCMGAEIILAPVNGFHTSSAFFGRENPPLWDTWHCVSRARAAENLVYVIVTMNIFGQGLKGVGHIAGPERMLAQSAEPGIFTAELDMWRLRWLRNHFFGKSCLRAVRQNEVQPPIGARVGQQRLRRPQIYEKLVEPLPNDFDYSYFERKNNDQLLEGSDRDEH